MSRQIKKIGVLLFLLVALVALKNDLLAYELNLQADVVNAYSSDVVGLNYFTFVKAAKGNKGHQNPLKLSQKTGTSTTYQTNRLLFHLSTGSKYDNSKFGANNTTKYDKAKKIVSYDGSKDGLRLSYKIITLAGGNWLSNYQERTELRTTQIKDKSDDNQILWPESSNSDITEEFVQVKGDLAISSFLINGDTYKTLMKNIKDNKVENTNNEYQIMVSNQLNIAGATRNTAWNFYDTVGGIPGFNVANYGTWVGQSALNNYDNNLFIPCTTSGKDNPKNINIRVAVQGENGEITYDNNKLLINEEHVHVYPSENYKKFKKVESSGNDYMTFKWEVSSADDDSIWFNPKEIINLSDGEIITGVAYEAAMEGRDSYPKTPNADNSIWISGQDGEQYFYITYYVTKANNTHKCLEVTHIDKATGEIIQGLGGTENFDNGSGENLTKIYSNNSEDPQSKYFVDYPNATITLKWPNVFYSSDGISFLNDPVNIDGKYYIPESITNKTGSNSSGKVNFSEYDGTVKIVYYYQQVFVRELYVNNIDFSTGKKITLSTDSTKIGNAISSNIFENVEDLDNNIQSVKTLSEISTKIYEVGNNEESPYHYAIYYSNIGEYENGFNIYSLTSSFGLPDGYSLVGYKNATSSTSENMPSYTPMSNFDAARYRLDWVNFNLVNDAFKVINVPSKKEINDATIIEFYYSDGFNTGKTLEVYQLISSGDGQMEYANEKFGAQYYFDPSNSVLKSNNNNNQFEKYSILKSKDSYIKLRNKTVEGADGNTYECIGYSLNSKPGKEENLKNQDINSIGINKIVTGNKKNGAIYYVWKKINTNNDILKLKGWFDFINTKDEFKKATYPNNDSESKVGEISYNGSQLNMDKIPTGEYLAPYVAGAYPYFIKGIRYQLIKKQTTFKVTYKWQNKWESGINSETGKVEYSTQDCSKSKTFTVDWKYYIITDFIMYRISNVTYDDNETENYGERKIFEDYGNSQLELSDSYNDRSTPNFVSSMIKLEDVEKSLEGGGENYTPVFPDVSVNLQYNNAYIYLIEDGKNKEIVNSNKKNITVSCNLNKFTPYDSSDITFDNNNSISINVAGDANEYTKELENTYMIPSPNKLTNYTDFSEEENKRIINKKNFNAALQISKAKLVYKKVGNLGIEKAGNEKIEEDNEMILEKDDIKNYNKEDLKELEEVNNASPNQILMQFKKYGDYNNGEENNIGPIRFIDVFNPVSLDEAKEIFHSNAESNNFVDHTNNEKNYNLVLQAGATFTVTPKYKKNTDVYSNLNTEKYVQGYLLKFSFDIQFVGAEGKKVRILESEDWKEVNEYQEISQGTVIWVEGASTKFEAYPKGIQANDDSINNAVYQKKNKLSIVAITNNSGENYIKKLAIDLNENMNTFLGLEIGNSNSLGNTKSVEAWNKSEIYEESYYPSQHAAIISTGTKNTYDRVFGFSITDCTDVAWKDIFRKSDENGVNTKTGKVYDSGVKPWYLNDIMSGLLWGNTIKNAEERTYTIPLGPYKNKQKIIDEKYDSTYIYAPKLGYRFSFNVKATGYIDTGEEKYIKIEPSYYYISKDGKTFINDIELYYKTYTGKYIKFKDSNYKIYYKPNDGYRYYNSSITNYFQDSNESELEPGDTLSKKLIGLNISKAFTLENSSMIQGSDNYLQAWFGEFKLPNSTIAVKKDGKLSEPLVDGYIGVKFDISCITKLNDGSERTISYNTNNKAADSKDNTTQWDYEGFLGFTNVGKEANLTLQLEKGDWNIKNDIYNQIKGTVILYDTDSRAANDFN